MTDKVKILFSENNPNDYYAFFDTPSEDGKYHYIWVNRNHVSFETNSVGSYTLLNKGSYSYKVCKKGDKDFDIVIDKMLKFLDGDLHKNMKLLKQI